MATVITQERTNILKLVAGMFNAAPGAAYLNEFTDAYVAMNKDLGALAAGLGQTGAFKSLYPSFLTADEFANKFLDTLGLKANTEAQDWVKAKVNAGESFASVAFQALLAIDASTADDFKAAREQLANKATAAEYYSVTLQASSDDLAALQNVVAKVTDDPASVTAANEANAGGNGKTFTLTTGPDNIVGTSGNDTINGFVASAAAATSTLTGADQINGGAGTDTLNITATGDTAASLTLGGANITGVETINVRNVDGDTNSDTFTVSAATIAGLTAVYADRASDDITVTGLAAGAKIGMIGDGTLNNADVNFAYAAPTSAISIDIQGGTKTTAAAANGGSGAITATASTGVTTATIASSGAANSVGVIKLDSAGGNTVTSLTVNAATNLTAKLTANDFAATAALTVSGAAASVDLGTAFDGKTIDASGLTAGGLTIATNGNLTSFKGGQGNDTVTTSALAAAAVAGAVDAGAGTGDILNVATGTDVDSAAKAALFTNFEVLRNSGATDLDVSLLSGITSVQLNSANAGATKLTAAQAADIKVLATNTTNTIALATATGTADVLGLTLENLLPANVATAIDVTALTATGFETLNVVSSSGVKAGGTGVGNDLAFAAAGDLTAINVSGAYDLTIAAANITKAVNITSTQSGTAALYVSGDFANGSSVTGSGGADAFVLGAGFGSYNGGAGNDTISATAAQLNTGANYNVINGGEGTDTLNITGGGALTIVDNNLSKISGIEKIVVATTTTNAQSIQTGGWFDAAFKASGVDLTTTASTGNITIDMTSFTGAAKLNVTTVGTAGAEGTISVQTGSGNDDVTVSAAAAGGAGTVSTFDGNDKITTASTEAFAITAGKGNDTIVLGSTGIETLTFEATAANNGVDTITGFEFGAGKDVLQFKNFVGAAEAETLGGTIAGSVDASAKNVLTLTDIQDLTAANFGGSASATIIKTAASQKLVVIADKAADADSIQNIYYVTTDASNVATVTLVGTINEGTFHTDNIITA